MSRKSLWSAALGAALTFSGGWAGAQSNGVLREVYLNIGGVTVADLTNNPAFPDNPTFDEVITNGFEAPLNVYDSYGQRLRALVMPPTTGNYAFYIASDDASHLYLSTDATPANKRLIAQVLTWTDSRVYQENRDNNAAAQKSTNIALTAGQSYYIEALMKEGGGGDNLAVTWQKPGEGVPANGAAPIPNSALRPYGLGPPQITSQPTNVTATENTLATFSVQLARKTGAAYQWLRNGTNIPGATGTSYTLQPLRLADGGSTFRCFVTNSYGSTNSATATLTVLADTNRPTLVSVANLGDNQLVTVVFSELMDPVSASTATNYTLNNGATVLSASLSDDGLTVILTTTPLSPTLTYTLTVNNVRDRAQTPNVILPNTQRTFSLLYTPLAPSYITGTNEPAGPSSRRTGLVITEIMYRPTNRVDGRNLEFIEIYNSNPWPEDLSNHRLSGSVDYTFPAGTSIGALSYRVIAPKPADVQAVYGLTGVLGPLTNSTPGNLTNVLDNGGGRIRLRDELNSVLLEVNYDDEWPYPVSPDGTGHSLVLARPSYGEGEAWAWAASDRVGGTPGANETIAANPWRTVLINEFLAHTDEPEQDFIELFNYGVTAVDVGNCYLSDDPTTNKFRIPAGTVIPARGWVSFNQTQLGFALDASGEAIYFWNTNATKVLDALKFGAQENGVAMGRYPDGAPTFHRLASPTPGAANARPRRSDLVINELMYHPLSENDADEFVEIYNRGTNAVALTRWRLRGGVSYNFPNGTLLAPNSYLVVARDLANLRLIHPNLTPANSVGNYTGRLGNGGDTVTLEMPDDLVSTNQSGQFVTNRIQVVVDDVTYRDGGRWGQWADGGGSSLELVDAHADSRLAPNWADSDESAKSDWVTVQFTGLLDHGGQANADQLHLFMQGEGECLVDNVEVLAGANNVVANGSFDAGTNGWFFQGTHDQSYWRATGGYSGGCLHIVATGRGDTGANRVRTALTQTLSAGSTATLRARVKWLKGSPAILLRLRGNYLEATTNIVTTRRFGTPGLPNSRARTNVGPALSDVRHTPILPAAGQAVTVTAQAYDPDGIASLLLRYRVDPSTNYTTISMIYNGAGFYSASIPGQSSGARVAFYLEAQDNFSPRATSFFPNDAPVRECVVRFGETVPSGSLGTYLLWFTQRNVNRWTTREKNSNEPLDGAFVYGNFRVVYNVSGYYKGSPWHTPGYSGPDGAACDYKLVFPKDDLMLGQEDVVLATIGNLGSIPNYQGEQVSLWISRKLGAPYLYRRYVRLFFNGQQRQNLYEDSQAPNSDVVSQFFPDDDEGSLHKIEDWFEFDDSGDTKLGNVDATLQNFTTSGGVKKTARYRWCFRPRMTELGYDFTNLFTLVDAVNATQPEPYTTQIQTLVDVDNFVRGLAMQRIVGNWDSWGYARGKNMYIYKPQGGRWVMIPWDIDFVFDTGGRATNEVLFGSNEPTLDRLRSHPVFQRAYWRAFEDAVNGPLLPAVMNPILDAKYSALSSFGAGSPQGIKDYVAGRRAYIVSQLATVAANFTVSGSTNYSTNRNLITLTGTAPIGVATITVNGIPYPVTWSTVTGYSLRFALTAGTNSLVVQGWNNKGQLVANATVTLTINYTGINERPEDKLVINELMYNPTAPEAEFLELYNTSTTNAFDLSYWRLRGLDADIPPGTIINPGQYLVFAQNRQAFAAAHGGAIPVAGEYSGRLDNSGESVTLIKPGVTPDLDQVIDQVFFEPALPWPAGANGGGYSLQLMDPAQDNRRVANWSGGPASSDWRLTTTNALCTGTNVLIYMDVPGDAYLDDVALVPLAGPLAGQNVITNGDFESPLSGPWTILGTYYTNSAIVSDVARSGARSLRVVGTGAGSTSQAIRQLIPPGATNVTNTLSFWTKPGSSGSNLYIRAYPGTGPVGRANILAGTNAVAALTPGTNNSVRATLAAFPPLWLNEIQPQNVTGPTDRFGHRHPWVELYNSGTNALNLHGFHLTTNYANLTQWAFPTGVVLNAGQFLTVWLSGNPGESTNTELHTSFTVPPGAGSLALVASNAMLGGLFVLDYLNYKVPSANRSYGNYPDGNPCERQSFSIVTPNATNNPNAAPVTVFINEWMADNFAALADPYDGNYEDWFELYNADEAPADLSGSYLTDNLANPLQWRIPTGTVIPGRGFLLVWADNEPEQNGAGLDLHASFALAKGGEAIGLYGPGGLLVDAVTFGEQTTDVSQGRFPDGSATIKFLTTPTPRAPNVVAEANLPPRLNGITPKTVAEGSLLTFTVTATDSNQPPQGLTFTLEPDAPTNAFLEADSGVFSWIPTEDQGPGVYTITVRVTDDGTPPLSDTTSFTVQVLEVNNAPVLQQLPQRTIDEGRPFAVTNVATDPDFPPQTLTFGFDSGAQPGMELDPVTGVLTWTPTEEQGPGTYFVSVRVTDNGSPPQHDIKGFTLVVLEINSGPALAPLPNLTNYAGHTISFTASATDPDLPPNTLSYSLAGEPPGATINPATGGFSWTPAPAQSPSTNWLTVRVTDDGSPPLSNDMAVALVVLDPVLWASVTRSTNSLVIIGWDSVPTRRYQVQYKDDLGAASWSDLGGPVEATTTHTEVLDALGASLQRFYRVEQVD